MQRAGEAVQAGDEREVRIAQRAPNQVRGVRRHVPALMVDVNGHVQPHELLHGLGIVPHHVREVRRPVQTRVGGDERPILERSPVDRRAHCG